MTGVELYIRDNDYFYCYKQRHDGYLITDFVKKFGDKIFTMSADEIIHTFHDENFLEDSWGNYHTEGKPLEYGVKIPASEISDDNFDANAKWSGVHDGSGGEKWFGYSSYEIEDFNTAIKMWFDFFKENNKLGENSEIFITDEDDKIFN